MWPHILFLLCWNALLGVRAFTVTTSPPTQCGTYSVNWTGGQPPFVLELFPVLGTQRVFNIPASAFSNGVGSYSTQLQLAQEQQFLASMSDATGFATGGISPLLTVQAQTPQSSSCNTVDPGPQFVYSLDVALQQCQPYTFSNYTGATLPVAIYGLVPGGTGIVLNAPNGADEFVWNAASIPAGTSVLFAMSDAQNRTGGVSSILVSGSTGDASCLNANSPSVTQQSTPSTRTSLSPSSSASSPAKATTSSKSNKISGMTVFAVIAGILVFLGVVAALGLFLLRRCRKNSSRRRRANNFDVDGGYQDTPSLVSVRSGVEPFSTAPASVPPPLEMTRMDNSAASLIRSAAEGTSNSLSSVPPPSTAASSRKTNITPTRNQPARFILHTDVEEVEPDENGFIELPPQYSATRRPLAPYGSPGNAVPPSVQSSYTR
ncbi:hypothetical protein EI94DRAFT_1829017 [Lactarius quietus]|nr:hypothetical protein EI94DRAFT_1829017 [Lactarius quietus]